MILAVALVAVTLAFVLDELGIEPPEGWRAVALWGSLLALAVWMTRGK